MIEAVWIQIKNSDQYRPVSLSVFSHIVVIKTYFAFSAGADGSGGSSPTGFKL